MLQAGNRSLIERIQQQIKNSGGAISFAEYMYMCLYDEQDGYYTNDNRKVGKEGDFYTSAYVGGAMGAAIALFVAEAAEKGGLAAAGETLTLVEWGGGEGRLAKAVLDTLESDFANIYGRVRFVSVESSPFHRQLQKEALASHSARVEAILHPGDDEVNVLLSRGFTVLYANELLDAFPVRRLRKISGELMEIFVGWDEEKGTFAEVLAPLQDGSIYSLLDRLSVRLQEGQTAEVNMNADEWIRSFGAVMTSGAVALIDYGDVSSELYGSHRMNGTLVCYRKHAAHDNPYIWVGEQDMTAHVDFGLCRLSASEAAFTDAKLRTQKQFLVDYGILRRLQAHAGTDPFSPEARNNRAIRQLLLSDGMSELFKVLTFRKE